MCFYIDSKHQNKKKAKRGITCYKILLRNWKSTVRDFEYIQGITYLDNDALNLERGIFGTDVINRGYHSYSSKNKVLQAYGLRDFYYKMIVKCIIPKGSEYYYNSDLKEYVSNQIIIKEKVKCLIGCYGEKSHD